MNLDSIHNVFRLSTDNLQVRHQAPRGIPLPRLISYNQFPLHYASIRDMTADLPRIRDMGFTSIWSNPMFETCESIEPARVEIERGLAASGYDGQLRMHAKPGSPYALKSLNISPKVSANTGDNLSDDERRTRDYADIRAYTAACKELGMTPLSDFVMRHVAVDHPLVTQKPHWFKRHDNGNFKFFGRDENYHPTTQSWDDVYEFNFDDPAIRNEIIDQHIRPMADLIIGDLGFAGVRIDAAGKISRDVYREIIPVLDELSMKRNGKPAVILGETLGQNIHEFMHLGGYADYVYNSVYFYPFAKPFWERDDTPLAYCKGNLQHSVAPTIGFAGNHDVGRVASHYSTNQHIRGSLLRDAITSGGSNDIIRENIIRLFVSLNDQGGINEGQRTNIKAAANAGGEAPMLSRQTIQRWFKETPASTPRGSAIYDAITNAVFDVLKHEKQLDHEHGDVKHKSLLSEAKLIRVLPSDYDAAHLYAKIRESFCLTAFASDGGWFFSLGDEWGVTKRTNVFSATPADLEQRLASNPDFSGFIKSVNATLKALPPPANPEWAQRCFLPNDEKDSEIIAMFLHQGHGFNGSGHLVMSNISDESQTIGLNMFNEYRKANNRNIGPGKERLPDAVYLCGTFTLEPELKSYLEANNVQLFDAERTGQRPTVGNVPAYKL